LRQGQACTVICAGVHASIFGRGRADLYYTEHLMTLDLSDWSNGELNAPAYPETRVFKKVAQSLCTQAVHPAEIQLVVQAKPNRRTGAVQEQTYPCTALR
jgi:hypothetical protein